MAKIIVIGGGIAGSTTAIELASRGHRVVILEQKSDILQATSGNTPGRMGLGYHYFHFETAKFYLERTVEFMQKYSKCFLGDSKNEYLQKGRYFIVKDSLTSVQELMSNYDAISLYFEEMCEKKLSNKIFKKVHLHRAMHPSEFSSDVNVEKVQFAIETQEHLLDFGRFKKQLKKEISQYSNIRVKTKFKVDDILTDARGKYIISSEKKGEEAADYVVNCTWQNIEFLNEKLGISGFQNNPKKVTSRLKLLAEVKLPKDLIEKNSMFFCVGPHAMFSNLGGGIGRITYAPVTNFGTTNEVKMPSQFERWLSEGLNFEETMHYGQAIIDGVSKYIPAMKDATIIKVMPGIVKSVGEVDIYDKNSDFHKRDYDGVSERQIGWIENAAMKLFYCLANARKTADIIEKQRLAKEDIREIIDLVLSNARAQETNKIEQNQEKTFEHLFTDHLQKNFTSDYFSTIANEIFVKNLDKKKNLSDEN